MYHLGLRLRHPNPNLEKLLTDFIGQPSLLTPSAFIDGFLDYGHNWDRVQMQVIKYGWREAIVLGLQGGHVNGGEKLRREIMIQFPDQFAPNYPPSNGVPESVLEKFKTKWQLENEWAEKNAPNFQAHFRQDLLEKLKEEQLTYLLLPVLWDIVSGYTAVATWLDVEE